jgi:hypothetical protein
MLCQKGEVTLFALSGVRLLLRPPHEQDRRMLVVDTGEAGTMPVREENALVRRASMS